VEDLVLWKLAAGVGALLSGANTSRTLYGKSLAHGKEGEGREGGREGGKWLCFFNVFYSLALHLPSSFSFLDFVCFTHSRFIFPPPSSSSSSLNVSLTHGFIFLPPSSSSSSSDVFLNHGFIFPPPSHSRSL